MKIFLIEDDSFFVGDIKYILEDENHEVTVCDEPDKAIEQIDTLNQYDIIILDIMMMAGDMTLEKAKEFRYSSALDSGEIIFKLIRRHHPEIKIIVLTARDLGDIQTNFSKEKNTLTLIKPLDDEKTERLLDMIK